MQKARDSIDSLVLSSSDTVASSSTFSDKVSHAFDGHFDYAFFREDESH